MKNAVLSFLLVSFVGSLYSAENTALKSAVRQAAGKALPRWVAARAIPTVGGAGMVAVPVILIAGGFMAGIGNAGTCDPVVQDRAGAAIVVGALTFPLVAAGILLLKRQAFLITRDLWLFNKFTSSTAQLNPSSLPTAERISAMNTHHQLLSSAKDYISKEGNLLERATVSIPGLRGFKQQRS